MKRLLSLVAFFAVVGSVLSAEIQRMTSKEAAELVKSGKAVLVDVREPEEWAETGVAEPAVLLPMSDFEGEQKLWKPFFEQNKGKEILLYCRSGNRSGRVAAKLAQQGLSTANAGAFKDWAAAGLPVRKP